MPALQSTASSSPLASFWFPLSFVRSSAIAEYPDIYSRISMFVNIMGAVGPVFWAFLGGFGYPILFAVAIVLLVVVLVLGLYSFSKAKTVQDQWTE